MKTGMAINNLAFVRSEIVAEQDITQSKRIIKESIDIAISAMRKQMPKKVDLRGDEDDIYAYCPNCDTNISDIRDCGWDYCPYCGQAIEKVYEIVGVMGGKAITYKAGTIAEIEENELLKNHDVEHGTIEEIITDMDIFSNYKHYYRIIG